MQQTSDYFCHAIIIMYIVSFNLITYFSKEQSQKRYLLKKGKEQAENRLEVIMNAFTDGICVISEQNAIEYANQNLLDILMCNREDLISTLNNIKYCNSKKYCNLTTSDNLMDDIVTISTQELNRQIMLGISKNNDISIE